MTINLRTREGWDDLKRLLDERPDDVLRLCGIDVKRLGGGWTVIDDPLGRGRDCFGLCLRGGFLTWKQFNGDAKGRALELIAYCNGWYDQDKRGAEPAARLALQHFGAADAAARAQRGAGRPVVSGHVRHAVGSRLRMPGRADRLRGRLQIRDRQLRAVPRDEGGRLQPGRHPGPVFGHAELSEMDAAALAPCPRASTSRPASRTSR
jgi:hypothetical protein